MELHTQGRSLCGVKVSVNWGKSGADGIRTHDLRIANATLSQLSYGPMVVAVLNDRPLQHQF